MRQAGVMIRTGDGAVLWRMPELTPGALLALLVCLAAVMAGGLYVTSKTPLAGFFAVAMAICLLGLLWLRPVFGLVALLFLAASFVEPNLIDLRLLGGGLNMSDMALIALLVTSLVKGAVHRRLEIPAFRVSLPLLVYFCIALLSAIDAMSLQGVSSNWALSEFRCIFYLATFFAVSWNVKQVRDVYILLFGLIVMADLTALVIILQQFISSGSFLAGILGRTWFIRNTGDVPGQFGDVRVVPPGNVLMFMTAVIVFALLLQSNMPRSKRIFLGLQFAYLVAALLFTYTRGEWIGTAMGMVIVVIVLPMADKMRLARYVLGLILAAGVVYSLSSNTVQQLVVQQQFLGNLSARALSIFTPESTLETNSLQWRVFENGKAFESITRYPLFGVGLGNAYRPITLLQWEDRRFYFRKTRFVHNSYLYIAVKMGLVGLGVFLTFCLSFLVCGWLAFRKLPEGDFKRATIGILGGFAGLLFWANTQMHFMAPESTAVVGVMVGLVAVMSTLKIPKTSSA